MLSVRLTEIGGLGLTGLDIPWLVRLQIDIFLLEALQCRFTLLSNPHCCDHLLMTL